MSTRSPMPQSLRRDEVASHRQDARRDLAESPQIALSFDAEMRRCERTTALYDMARRATAAAGGADALRAMLDERESYAALISKALHRIDDNGQRKVPLEWLAALMEDPEAGAIICRVVCELTGHEPPVRSRVVTREQVAEAALDVCRDLGPLANTVRSEIAKRLGVRVEEVKL